MNKDITGTELKIGQYIFVVPSFGGVYLKREVAKLDGEYKVGIKPINDPKAPIRYTYNNRCLIMRDLSGYAKKL